MLRDLLSAESGLKVTLTVWLVRCEDHIIGYGSAAYEFRLGLLRRL